MLAARASLAAARKIAPDHPDVLLLTAEHAVDGDEIDAAKRALDALAAARPGTVDEAALRVAIALEEGGAPAAETALARVRAIDPRSALGLRRAGEQAERRYRFDEAVAFMRSAVALDPSDPQAHLNLGLYLMRTGEEAAARLALDRSWELDKSAQLTKNLLDVLDRLDTFEVVPAGEIVFKFAKDESPVLKAYALPLADEAYKSFSTRYGFTPAGPILIEVFPVHDDFAVRTLGLPGLVGALGACFGRRDRHGLAARAPAWGVQLAGDVVARAGARVHVAALEVQACRAGSPKASRCIEEHRRRPAWGRELTLEFAHAAVGRQARSA